MRDDFKPNQMSRPRRANTRPRRAVTIWWAIGVLALSSGGFMGAVMAQQGQNTVHVPPPGAEPKTVDIDLPLPRPEFTPPDVKQRPAAGSIVEVPSAKPVDLMNPELTGPAQILVPASPPIKVPLREGISENPPAIEVEVPAIEVEVPEPVKASALTLFLPSEFVNEDVTKFLRVTSRAEGEDEQDCKLKGSKLDTASYTFDCPTDGASEYSATLVGFEPLLDMPVERKGDSVVADIASDDLISTATARVQPKGGVAEGGEPAKSVAVGENWPSLIGSGEKVINSYFANLDPDATNVWRYCKQDGDGMPLKSLLVDEQELVIKVKCRYALVDRTGLPADLAEVELSGCDRQATSGAFCILDAKGGPLKLELDKDSPWQVDEIPASDHIRLADLVRFPDAGNFLNGSMELPYTGGSVRYEVVRATLSGADGSCEPYGTGKKVFKLAKKPLSDADCGDVAPTDIELELRAAEGSPSTFLDTLSLPLSLAELFEDKVPNVGVALGSMTIELRTEDGRPLPEFYEMRVYASMDDCVSGGTVLKQLTLSGNQRPDIDKTVMDQKAPAYMLLTGKRPMTECALLELGEPELSGKIASVSVTIKLIRPSGPYTIVVLVPTERLDEEGWRGVINTTLLNRVTKLAEEKKALATDLFEITESGALRTVVAGEDYRDLPTTGDVNSITGRFDTIYYNAATSQPLASINLVQANTADTDITKAVLIVDSTNEKFEPRDRGSLYHWLINRKIELKVISLGKCEGWTNLSTELVAFDKKRKWIECYDLSAIDESNAKERAKLLDAELRPYFVPGVK